MTASAAPDPFEVAPPTPDPLGPFRFFVGRPRPSASDAAQDSGGYDERHLAAVPTDAEDPGDAPGGDPDPDFLGLAPNPGPWSVRRHPEDPARALEAAVDEVGLCDPDQFRVRAVALGKASQALPRRTFYVLSAEVYEALAAIRAGALRSEAIGDAQRHLETVESTDTEVEQIEAEAEAGRELLVQLAELRSRQEEELHWREEEVSQGESALIAHDQASIDDEGRVAQAQAEDPTAKGNAFQWLTPTKKTVAAGVAAEITLSGLLLASPIEKLISVEVPYSGALLGVAISALLFLVAWNAGRALAALKLPGWLVSFFFVACAAALFWRATISIDAIRVGDGAEGRKFLTVATLANLYVGSLTSYASSVYGLFERRREALTALPTRVELMVAQRNRLLDRLDETLALRDSARQTLQDTEARVAELREAVAGAASRARKRRAEGQRAEVAVQAIRARLEVHVGQEDANAAGAQAAAGLSYEKTRAELYPSSDVASKPAVTKRQSRSRRLVAALAGLVALAGLIGALMGFPLALLATVGAILVLLALLIARRRRRPDLQPNDGLPAAIEPLVEPRSQDWRFLPQSTRPKHGRGGSGPSNRD